ncbi:hypothetical protein M8J76_000494 [Diaphorina citri]|nr:hypothetical protein M8J76_000494 [Diaphorina citri]
MSAMETIAWMRICRPGCVIGVQQDWLKDVQHVLQNVGDKYRSIRQRTTNIQRHPYGIYSKKWKAKQALDTRSPGMGALTPNKENSPVRGRGVHTAPAIPKREQNNFVLANIKKPLTTLCRRKPNNVMNARAETQADNLLLVKTNKARKYPENAPTKI